MCLHLDTVTIILVYSPHSNEAKSCTCNITNNEITNKFPMPMVKSFTNKEQNQTASKQKQCSSQMQFRILVGLNSNQFTVKNGCRLFWRTLFSVSVCATSSYIKYLHTVKIHTDIVTQTYTSSTAIFQAKPTLAECPFLWALIWCKIFVWLNAFQTQQCNHSMDLSFTL